MTSQALFARLSSGEAAEVLEWLQANDRAAYKSCVGLVATRRKLRPVFVERKPRGERNAWMRDALGKPANADIATEVLQSWLLAAHGALVCDFLDSLKISHDGKGLLESLPPEPPGEQVDQAVSQLFSKYPAHAVRIYLNLFTSMEMTGWPHLTALVSSDPRICQNPTNP